MIGLVILGSMALALLAIVVLGTCPQGQILTYTSNQEEDQHGTS